MKKKKNNIQHNKTPFIIGLFYGSSKPKDPNEFLKMFVDESIALFDSCISINGKVNKFAISAFVCDIPARSFIKGNKGHGAYYGCDKCCQKGVYARRVTFPDLQAKLRTDCSFSNMTQREHHVKESVLVQLGVGMITQFPSDYMHLVCLGVVRKLMFLCFKGPLHVRIGPRNVKKLSDKLIGATMFVPKEFARKPRSVTEFERYKATEFRQFLLYTGVTYLAEVLPEALYKNFLLLSVAMRIFLCPQLAAIYAESAHTLLTLFIQHASALFGSEVVTYNLHGLSHLCSDVK